MKRGSSRGWHLVVPLLALGLTLAVGSIPLGRLQASPAAAASSTAPYAPGVLLVRRKAGVTTAALTAQTGVSGVDATVSFIGAERVRVARGQEQAIARRLVQDGVVEYAQPDYLRYTTDVTPNDQYYSLQWDMPKIEAPAAWGVAEGSTSVTVAVIDTGYDLDHRDRPANLVAGPTYTSGSAPYDFCPPEGTNGPEDDEGHGTHVGGTVAAAFNNGTDVAGLAPGVKLLVIKAGDCAGSFADSDIAQAMGYAASNGAKVINMSFGGPGYDPALDSAVQTAWSQGVVLVAAAGNDGNNESFSPADLSHVMAVAATGQNDNRASFSNYGSAIAVAAPGVNILSTYPPDVFTCPVPGPNSETCYLSGTSMASPHVAALAGLVLSYVPTLSNSQVVSAIEQGAVPLGGSVPNQYYGYGRIDACVTLGDAKSLASVMSTILPLPSRGAASTHLVYLPLVPNRVCL